MIISDHNESLLRRQPRACPHHEKGLAFTLSLLPLPSAWFCRHHMHLCFQARMPDESQLARHPTLCDLQTEHELVCHSAGVPEINGEA